MLLSEFNLNVTRTNRNLSYSNEQNKVDVDDDDPPPIYSQDFYNKELISIMKRFLMALTLI